MAILSACVPLLCLAVLSQIVNAVPPPGEIRSKNVLLNSTQPLNATLINGSLLNGTLANGTLINGTKNEGVQVDGNAPLYYWGSPESNIFQIEHAMLTPQQCQVGKPCILVIAGEIQTEITNGLWEATVTTRTPSGPITKNYAYDICSIPGTSFKQWGQTTCPPGRGVTFVTHELPTMEPWAVAGDYNVNARISCDEGTVYALQLVITILPAVTEVGVMKIAGNVTTS